MSLKDTFNNIRICEASLGRIKQHFDRGDVLLFISANRNENTPQENRKNFKELQRYFRAANYGFNKIKGSYVEKKEDGSSVVVDEDSLVVFAPKEEENTLFKLGLKLGIKYKQDSILFVDSEGKAKLISTREDSFVGAIGSKQPLGAFAYTRIGDYFSKVGKKEFSFKTIDEEVEPTKSVNNGYISEAFKEVINKYDDPIEEWDSRVTYADKGDIDEVMNTPIEELITNINKSRDGE